MAETLYGGAASVAELQHFFFGADSFAGAARYMAIHGKLPDGTPFAVNAFRTLSGLECGPTITPGTGKTCELPSGLPFSRRYGTETYSAALSVHTHTLGMPRDDNGRALPSVSDVAQHAEHNSRYPGIVSGVLQIAPDEHTASLALMRTVVPYDRAALEDLALAESGRPQAGRINPAEAAKLIWPEPSDPVIRALASIGASLVHLQLNCSGPNGPYFEDPSPSTEATHLHSLFWKTAGMPEPPPVGP